MNSTAILYLSAETPTTDYTKTYGPILIKGTSNVVFNLSNISEETNPVVKIEGRFGDGTTYSDTINLRSTLKNYDAVELTTTGKIGSITQQFSHTYEKDRTTFVSYTTASFILTYTSQVRGTHNIAFIHAKDSYYDDVKQLHLNSTQIMPVSSNDIFAVASNSSGDIFYLYFGNNEINSSEYTTTSSASAVFLSPQTLQNCFVMHTQQGSLIVPKLST